jgi:hypothetical protein
VKSAGKFFFLLFCLNVVFFLRLVLLLNGKILTLANGYKMKTLANGYKSTEKKTVANVFICLLLHLPFATEEDRNSFYRTQQLF